jgi:hypothetical protein
MSVLPVDVEFSSTPGVIPTLNGLKNGTVTVLISPILYIGFTKNIRGVCGEPNGELEIQREKGWGPFKVWRRNDGLIGAARRLSFWCLAKKIDPG